MVGLNLSRKPQRRTRFQGTPLHLVASASSQPLPVPCRIVQRPDELARDCPAPGIPDPGLWITWDASLALHGLRYVVASVSMPSPRSRRGRIHDWEYPEGFWGYARQLRAWSDPRLMESFVKCPACDGNSPWLIFEGGWHCCFCWSRSTTEHVDILLHLRAARYQFGLLVGARGRRMQIRRQRLANRVINRMAIRAPVTSEFLRLLPIVARLLEVAPDWRLREQFKVRSRRPRELPPPRGTHDPVWRAVAPYIPQAYVDCLLQPDAYIRRYAEWLEDPRFQTLRLGDSFFSATTSSRSSRKARRAG